MLASPGLTKSTVSVLASRLVPASLLGSKTAFRALTGIDEILGQCHSAGEAATVLDRSKAGLHELLRKRFSSVEAQALALKILNLWLARHHFRARDTLLLSHPFGIVVDPSNMCQLACPGCVHSERSELLRLFDWPKGTLSELNFAALLRLYGPTAIAVYFCDYGEPLLNLNTPKLIRMAKSYLMATALSTSLSVRRFDPEAYVASGLDFMVLSIDGATQPVYERFRRNGNLELVLKNVARLVDAKRRLRRRTPLLSWNFLAFEHNAHEIPAAERMARRLGVNYFRVVNPFDVSWDDPDIRPAAVKPYVRRLDWTSIANPPENWNPFPEAAEAGTIAAAFEKPLNRGTIGDGPASSGHTCHWLYKNIVMDATGRVLPCCGAPRLGANLVFGTLDGHGGDPFNSERYRQARAFFAGNSSVAGDRLHCSQCEWDQTTVNIGGPEIRRYFRAADPWFFDRRSLHLLSAW
jgi:MoaA/NifB/PqqE/SkfB family radical SAM enzyme